MIIHSSYPRKRKYFFTLCCGLLAVLLPLGTALAQSCPLYPSAHLRMGFNVAPDGGIDINNYDAARLGAGWYHNYGIRKTPYKPGGIQYHQMVRPYFDMKNLPTVLGPTVDANPGAMWILGNEPDRYGQDGQTAAEYAVFYHDAYTFLKNRDPSSRVAIGGVVQPTPLRLRYLDLILAEYQQRYGVAMPVEIWDIHNFILPENCEWGASIPPGLEAYRSEGTACDTTLNKHGDIAIFKQQIRDFRQWMKARGYQDRPLIISEYGILLSKYHGYDYARVRNFMTASFDYMINTTDSTLGYTADGNRLVQEFAWFSLNYWEFNINTYFGLNGNLFDHDSRQIMPLGLDYAAYAKKVTNQTIDLAATDLHITPATANLGESIQLSTTFVNSGAVAAENVAVRFWAGDPRNGGQLLGASTARPQVAIGCQQPLLDTITWTPTTEGSYTIYTELVADNMAQESNLTNNYRSQALAVLPLATSTPLVTPESSITPDLSPTATATTLGATTPTATLTSVDSTPTATVTPNPMATPNLTVTATPILTVTPTPLVTATPTPLVLPTVDGSQQLTPTPTSTPVSAEELRNHLYFPIVR